MRHKFLIVFFVLFISSFTTVVAQQESKTYIIIYDEGHGQYFTSDLMETALDSLNQSLDTEDLDVTVRVRVNDGRFTSTNMQGSNLVLISNPGQAGDLDLTNQAEEREALNNYIIGGGNVLYLSNPFSYDQNISGHAEVMNNLLVFESINAIQVATGGDTDNTTVIIDDANRGVNDSFVYLNASNINYESLTTELNNINASDNPQFLYYGNHINVGDGNPLILGNTSRYAYSVAESYRITGTGQFQAYPNWLYGAEIGDNNGRALIVGSTIMFSDLDFDNENSWVEMEQNLALFQNIVAWLLGLTPLEETIDLIERPFEFFLGTNLGIAILLGAVIFFLQFLYFSSRGRLSFSQIFSVRETRKPQQTDKGTSKAGDKKKKTTSAKKKKTRRKRT